VIIIADQRIERASLFFAGDVRDRLQTALSQRYLPPTDPILRRWQFQQGSISLARDYMVNQTVVTFCMSRCGD
jgi:hypothetical protein